MSPHIAQQTSSRPEGLLLLKGNQRVVVIRIPWYLESELVYLALIAVLKLSRTVRVS